MKYLLIGLLFLGGCMSAITFSNNEECLAELQNQEDPIVKDAKVGSNYYFYASADGVVATTINGKIPTTLWGPPDIIGGQKYCIDGKYLKNPGWLLIEQYENGVLQVWIITRIVK